MKLPKITPRHREILAACAESGKLRRFPAENLLYWYADRWHVANNPSISVLVDRGMLRFQDPHTVELTDAARAALTSTETVSSDDGKPAS